MSADAPLGVVFNQLQVAVFARLMAQIVGHALKRPITAKAGYHSMVNFHIYENQLALMKDQLTRKPYPSPRLHINPDIKTLGDLETWVTLKDFELVDYQYNAPIKYPFSV